MDDSESAQRGRVGLRVIAAFKFLKAITLIAAGAGTLGLLNPHWNERAEEWIEHLDLGQGNRLAAGITEQVASFLDNTNPIRLVALAVGAFLYGGVFLIEGVGLWLRKRWAEYLTIFVTASFLPFELITLIRHFTVAKAATLILNLLVVGYLVWQLRGRH